MWPTHALLYQSRRDDGFACEKGSVDHSVGQMNAFISQKTDALDVFLYVQMGFDVKYGRLTTNRK